MPHYRTIIFLTLSTMAASFGACAQATDSFPDLRNASRVDLLEMVQRGDATRADGALAEYRRRAAAGDPLAVNDLDDFLERRAADGSDADMSELLARAHAGDKRVRSHLAEVARSAALKGSAIALSDLRHAADRAGRARSSIDITPDAEVTFDEVLADRAVDGDAAALAELRLRVATGSMVDRTNKRPILTDALERLAGLGDPAIMDELQKAAADGDPEAQYALGRIFYLGTSVISRDFTMAAKSQGCPPPDETIMGKCRSIDMQALPPAIPRLLETLKCDDPNPSPVMLDLDESGTPQYKLNCHEPAHGPSDAVLIGMVHQRWQDITGQSPLEGYGDGCDGFFPLRTSHAGLHDICLENFCAPGTGASGQRCRRIIMRFGGEHYDEQQ